MSRSFMFKNVTVVNLRTNKRMVLILTTTNTALKIYQELRSHLNPREQNGDRLNIMPVIQHSDEMLLELTKIN